MNFSLIEYNENHFHDNLLSSRFSAFFRQAVFGLFLFVFLGWISAMDFWNSIAFVN